MKISVIIPTFKPGDYLWDCLDSLLSQTMSKTDFEVLLVLNGPEEPFKAGILDYIGNHSDNINIKFLYSSKPGVSNARNLGLENSSGKYIAFLDDDDVISPSYLEELHTKADEQTIVMSNTYNFTGDINRLTPVRTGELHTNLSQQGKTEFVNARRFFFSAAMKLIPVSVIGNRRFNPSFSIGEDCIFMFQISDKVKYADFTSSDAIYYRRVRPESAIHRPRTRWDIFINDIRMIARYTRIYLGGLRRYSFFFYLTRIRGSIRF